MLTVDLWTYRETGCLESALEQNINDDEAYEELIIRRDWVHINIFYRSIKSFKLFKNVYCKLLRVYW